MDFDVQSEHIPETLGSPSDPPRDNQAFADESFQEAEVGGYYILAAMVFEAATRDPARTAMYDLRGSRNATSCTGTR
ncbi:hypothetical protein [Saccharopolyspora pogona]|uniref:hypothetical protein n=1 Tax=Saccharopolyspora pogona TaxID=333966 RepID=UPI001685AFE9|nr:hypothetical protein [Saccharopolyspora pogona]